MLPINNVKNRDRDAPSFANINLLGKCNARCFFCLGLDIKQHIDKQNQLKLHFSGWKNFAGFLDRCKAAEIKKIYVTGQNTDSLLYAYLDELIDCLHGHGFQVGLRTNGYEALKHLPEINRCELSTGYSIHSLDSVTTKMILGRDDMPDWSRIIPATERPRVSIVLNRCNEAQFFDLTRYIASYPNVRYIQVRRPSTDHRLDVLAPDMAAYERVYTQVHTVFPLKYKFAGDAEVYDMYGKEVVFWRTIKTSVNSYNYFTDGTISDLYFIVEGYEKYRDKSGDKA